MRWERFEKVFERDVREISEGLVRDLGKVFLGSECLVPERRVYGLVSGCQNGGFRV